MVAIASDPSGLLWIGTQGGGLNQFDPVQKKFTHYQHDPSNPNSLNSNLILDIDVDSNGQVWVGTDGRGINHFNPSNKTFTHYVHDPNNSNSLLSDWIKAVYVDSTGSIWIGCDGGLSRFNPSKQLFTNYKPDKNDPNNLSNDTVNTVYEDSHGFIWIGANQGLNRLDLATQTFRVYSTKQGLSGNSILGILEDEQGYLWISTNKGLSKFDHELETFRNYDKRDGLQGNLFVFNSAFKDKTGKLFFGGVGGFNAFYPDKLTDNFYKPPVFLTNFQIFNQSVSIGKNSSLKQYINFADQITLAYHQSVFSFEFAALNYRSAQKNQYAYKMEGINKDWVYVDSKRRFATYTHLDPGNYIFKVKGSNNDGLWNQEGASVNVLILPPWWKTWWAYTLYLIVIISSIIGLFIGQQRKLAYSCLINEQLRQADKFKDEFLANTSHELRTPLNGIIGLAESLIDGIAGELNPKVKTNLSMIMGSGRRLFALVNDILDFSKLKQKDLELQLRTIELREIVEIVLTLSQHLKGQKDLQLVNAIDVNLPPALADENRLQQILYNLVGNAVKFTESGTIELTAKVVGQNLEIWVVDTGIGIPADKLERIFESFEQAEGSTAREYGGTGLGLTVSKQLVQLHSGKIWVESTPGVGSQFKFTLPISERGEITPLSQSLVTNKLLAEDITLSETTVSNHQTEEGQLKILVVDDEPVNLQVLVNHLSLHGYSVIKALSGIEALNLLEKGLKPNLILLDVMMPKMTDYEVMQKIRETYKINELPTLLLTAKNQVSDLVAGLEVGANDYLTKPISKHELLARVKTHLNLHYFNAAYGRFVPSEFLKFLNKDSIVDIQLGDQIEKEMTVLFSDIRDFTSLSEKMTPQDNFDFINAYLGQMEPIIHQHQGFIDKYIGDAIMALFPTNADNALQGAIAMLQTLVEYNRILQNTEFDAIRIGIGLHTGNLILGIIGGQARMDGTVISDSVNLASRIEGMTKIYGATLLISEDTYSRLYDVSKYAIRTIDRVKVKGKSEPITVYEVFDVDPLFELKMQTRVDFENGLVHYRQTEFTEAMTCFKQVLSVNSEDKAAQIYLKRCLHWQKIGVPDNWEGVETLNSK